MGGTLWRYHLCLQPISLEQQLGSSSWLAATAADGEQQLMMQWVVLIIFDLCEAANQLLLCKGP
jgi:hypothetical protein